MLSLSDILEYPTGVYSSKNSEGDDIIILRQQKHGFIVLTPSCHDWYKQEEFDERGVFESITYVK